MNRARITISGHDKITMLADQSDSLGLAQVWLVSLVVCTAAWFLGFLILRSPVRRENLAKRVRCLSGVRLIIAAGVVATVGASVVLLLMTLSTVSGPFKANRTGTIGEWLSGIGAIGAVIAAITAVLLEIHSRHEDEELSEAVKVFAYAQLVTEKDSQRPVIGSDDKLCRFCVRVRNNSSTPAYEPSVRYRGLGGSWSDDVITFDLGSGCIIPGDTACPAIRCNESTRHYARVECGERMIDLELTYRSATGKYWRVSSDGKVESAPTADGPWRIVREGQGRR